MTSETSYGSGGGPVLVALGLIGLVLASGILYLMVFPAKSTFKADFTITIPSGVSLDTTLNFRPPVLNLVIGKSVLWANKDDSPHTTTATLWPTGTVKWDSGELDLGDSFAIVFTVAGTYKYHCTFHPGWMNGTITVTP